MAINMDNKKSENCLCCGVNEKEYNSNFNKYWNTIYKLDRDHKNNCKGIRTIKRILENDNRLYIDICNIIFQYPLECCFLCKKEINMRRWEPLYPCGHYVHISCILNTGKRCCPICKTNIKLPIWYREYGFKELSDKEQVKVSKEYILPYDYKTIVKDNENRLYIVYKYGSFSSLSFLNKIN